MKLIVVYTGDGEGKTTASLGHILRALGYGKKCIMIQLLKGRKTGEVLFQEKYGENFKIYQFGTENFVIKPTEEDKKRAKEALRKTKEIYDLEKPFVLVLDEINVAISMGLVEEDDVIELLESIPEGIIILTGRGMHKKIIEKADIVTEMKEIKHDYPKRQATEGFEF